MPGRAMRWRGLCVCVVRRDVHVQQCPGADEMIARIVLEEMRQMWRSCGDIGSTPPYRQRVDCRVR